MSSEDGLFDDMIETGRTTIRELEKLSNLLKKSAEKWPASSPPSNEPFDFTGQGTDLSYFSNHSEMPISMIDNIQDEHIKSAVKDEFNKAAHSGKITISKEKVSITITQEGKEYINKPEFKQAASKNYETAMKYMKTTEGFEFKGNISDLSYFNHAETLDLHNILSHSDKETVTKVLGNIKNMQKNKLVSVDVNKGLVKATSRGTKLLASDKFKNLSKGMVTKTASLGSSAALASTGVGTIFVAIKTSAKVVSETAKIISSSLPKK